MNNRAGSRPKSTQFHKAQQENKNTTHEAIKYNHNPDMFLKSRKPRDVTTKPFEFSQLNNKKLNDIYKNYLEKHHRPNGEEIQTRTEYQRANIDRIGTNMSLQSEQMRHQQNNNYLELQNELKSEVYKLDSPPSAFRQPKSLLVKLQSQDAISKGNFEKKSIKEIEVQVDKMKVRFESSIFENVEAAQENIIGKLRLVNQKVITSELKVSKLIGFITNLSHMLNKMRYRVKENEILKELNQELQHKVNFLENQKKQAKQAKQIQSLRQTVNRVRQSNSMRQQRGNTPNKESRERFEIEKKILLKDNIQLKKRKEQIEGEYKKQRQEYVNLWKNYQQLEQYIKELQKKLPASLDESIIRDLEKSIQNKDKQIEALRRRSNNKEDLEKKLEVLEFEIDRKDLTINELTTSMSSNKNNINKKDQEIKNLTRSIRELNQNLEESDKKWRNSIEEKNNQIKLVKSKELDCKKEVSNLKKQLNKRELNELESKRQIQQLKQKIVTLEKQLHEKKQEKSKGLLLQQNSNLQLEEQISKLKNQIIILRKGKTEYENKDKEKEETIRQLREEKQRSERQAKKYQQQEKILQLNVHNTNLQYQTLVSSINKLLRGESFQITNDKNLMRLSERINSYEAKIEELELQVKKMNLHKNKIDHILHDDDQVQYNDFETTHVDAYYFREKNATDPSLKKQLKQVSTKLDAELNQNIILKAEVIRLKAVIKDLERNKVKGAEAFKSLVKILETKDRRQKEAQLTIILSVLEIVQQKEWMKKILIK